MTKCVETIVIDEDRLMCPFRIKKQKGQTNPQFSDHNPIIITFHIEHQKKKTNRPKKWKITEEGLEEFSRITTDGMEMDLPGDDVQERHAFENKMNSIMEKCFRKTKSRKINELSTHYTNKYKESTQFEREKLKGKLRRCIYKN